MSGSRGDHALSDLGNARRFVDEYAGQVRFDPQARGFRVFDEKRHALDADGVVERMAKSIADQLFCEAMNSDPGERARLARHAIAAQSWRGIRNMIELVKTEPGIPVAPDQLDSDPWLLTVLNGTIDLRTGELREHRAADLISKLAPVTYDPAARDERLEGYFSRCIPNVHLRSYLARFVGYALTGLTRERVVVFVYGPPASGKTTIAEAIKAMLGDYALSMRFETLVKRRDAGGARGDLARLRGVRFATASEIDARACVDVELLKSLTGGDRLAVRALYQDEVEFTPAAKLMIVANDLARFRHEDDAGWERVNVVPFDVSIPPEERDPTLREHLVDSPFARSALLAWAVRGCLEWQEVGLKPPPQVLAATSEYREEQSPLREFLDDRCELSGWIETGRLYGSYEEWCRHSGDKALKKIAFARALRVHGFEPSKAHGARGWDGLSLKGGLDRRTDGDTNSENSSTRAHEGVYGKDTSDVSSPPYSPGDAVL